MRCHELIDQNPEARNEVSREDVDAFTHPRQEVG